MLAQSLYLSTEVEYLSYSFRKIYFEHIFACYVNHSIIFPLHIVHGEKNTFKRSPFFLSYLMIYYTECCMLLLFFFLFTFFFFCGSQITLPYTRNETSLLPSFLPSYFSINYQGDLDANQLQGLEIRVFLLAQTLSRRY